MAAILGLTQRWLWNRKKIFLQQTSTLFNLPVQLADKYLACLGGYAFDGGGGGMLWLYGEMGTHKGYDNTRHNIFFILFIGVLILSDCV